MKDAPDAIERVWQRSGDYYRSITPRASGNAQRNTYVRGNQIKANYAYADRLDKGWSNQAPNGMSEPTLDYFEKQIQSELGKL